VKPIHRHLISTPVFAVLGRLGGALLPLCVAFYFGANASTDAFFLAFTLVISLTGLFAPFFESLLVPYLAEYKENPSKVSSICNGVLVLILPAALGVAVLVGFFVPHILSLGSGLAAESISMTGTYFFEMMPLFLFWILAAAGNSIFFTFKTFWYPAVAPLVRSLTAILFLVFLHAALGLSAATAGLAVGEVLRWFLGLGLLISLGYWKFTINWRESGEKIRQFMGQAGYQIAAMLALNLIPFTDQWFASWFGTGSVTLVSYADRVFQIPFQFAMAGFVQIFLSYWSESYVRESQVEFWIKAKRDIRNSLIAASVFSLVLIAARGPIIDLLYGQGRLEEAQLNLLKTLFAWFLIGFPAAVINLLYVRILFVMKKSSVFFVQSTIRLGLNILLNYVFMRLWGLPGIAMATAFVFVGSTLWMHRYLAAQWKRSQ